MSDQNDLTKHKADNTDNDTTSQNIQAQQVSIKAWTQKILVIYCVPPASMEAGNLMNLTWSMSVLAMVAK